MYPKINLNDCDQVLTGRYETSFHNDGTDFIDYGRPTWAVNNLRPSVDSFTIECKGIPEADGTFLSFGAGSVAGVRQFQIYRVSSDRLGFNVGGLTTEFNLATPNNQFSIIKVEVTPTGGTAFVNGEELGAVSVGTYQGSENLFIGGRTDGVGFNIEGYMMGATFWKGVGDSKELLEHFPLNGTPNGINGTVGTITDGSPEGVWNYKFCRDVSKKSYYGVFNGSNYLTVPKAQTITSEYKLFFETEIIPTTPNDTEVLYYAVTSATWFNIYVASNGSIVLFGNGASSTIVGSVDLGESNKLSLYLKDDSFKVKINGVWSSDFNVTWTDLNITSYLVGRQTVNFPYTGKMLYFKDQDEKFTLDNTLTGTLGTTATLTGSTEADFFNIDPNLYALEETATGNLNLNPTGSALIPYPNSFETKATLETYGDNLKTYVSKNTDSIFHNVTKKNSSFDPVAEFFTNKS